MRIFNFLRWTEKNRATLRIADYVMGVAAIGYGIWADSSLSIGIGVICIIAAAVNLSEKVNLFLPRLVSPKKKRPDA